jgi:hypothetical protein
MSEFFTYSSLPKPEDPRMTCPPPLACTQENYDKMIRAKQVNDGNYWSTMCEVFATDAEHLPMERFKVWASVMSVPLMSRARFTDYVGPVLMASKASETVRNALREEMIGYNGESDFQHYSMFENFPTTMNRIQHMAHLIINGWGPEELSKLDTIVELGGGIGDMADIVCKLGFKGKYIIYDFKEVGHIQKWYHDKLGHTNIVHTSDLNDLVDADLMIGTWSFTEMPLDLRADIMGRIGGTKNWLIAYSNLIFGIDNDKYITEDFEPRFTEHDIEYTDVPFMPWDGGTKYISVKHKS